VLGGEVTVNGHLLRESDGAALSGEDRVVLSGRQRGEVLLFDLA